MTNETARRASRSRNILAVQRQLQRVEEQRLAEIKRRANSLAELETELIELLNTEDTMRGLLTFTGVRRLSMVQSEMARVEEHRQAQAERLIAQTSRMKLAEKLSAEAEADARKAQDQQDLSEAIERFLRNYNASLP